MNGQIVVLGTGGTIAGEAVSGQDPHAYRAGALGLQQVLATVPGLDGRRVVAEDLARIDSKDMDWDLWRLLATRCAHWLARPDVAAVVITHGTDTLEETAWFLQRVLDPAKPVVLASAMRPASAPDADGPRNLRDAFVVARSPLRGVIAVLDGEVHAAADVRKVHPHRLRAFSSGDAGPMARVEDGVMRQLRKLPAAPSPCPPLERVLAAPQPWVEVVHGHAGASPRAIQVLVESGVQGLVVAAPGNGSVHRALEPALQDAIARGVRVLRSTRSIEGGLQSAPGDAIPAHPFTPAKARVDLLLDLLG